MDRLVQIHHLVLLQHTVVMVVGNHKVLVRRLTQQRQAAVAGIMQG
jgi:hypothetical protein